MQATEVARAKRKPRKRYPRHCRASSAFSGSAAEGRTAIVAGERRTAPNHYRFWRERGRLRKSYVRPADLAQTIARCQARRQMQQELKAGWKAWRQMVILVREAERR
jgi:hypothetical protein